MDRTNETTLPPPFLEWVAGKRDGDNPRGDFIRDTRRYLRQGGTEDNVEWEVAVSCPEAQSEHLKLKSEYRRKFGIGPSEPEYRYRRRQAVGLSWSEVRWRVLPYVVYICRNGNIVLGNRRYLPIWVWERESGSSVGAPDWRAVNERAFVKGIVMSLHTYDDSNIDLPRNKMIAHVNARLQAFRLDGLPPDWKKHRQATDRQAWDSIALLSEEDDGTKRIILDYR